LQKFDGAMAAWLAELGDTQINAVNYDQLLKTALCRDEAVHAALRCPVVAPLFEWGVETRSAERTSVIDNDPAQ